jgi:hypothetical protein
VQCKKNGRRRARWDAYAPRGKLLYYALIAAQRQESKVWSGKRVESFLPQLACLRFSNRIRK